MIVSISVSLAMCGDHRAWKCVLGTFELQYTNVKPSVLICNALHLYVEKHSLSNIIYHSYYLNPVLFHITGAALVQCGQTQIKLGQIEREYMQSSVNNFINPLRNFLDGDMKTIMVTYSI